MKRTFKHEKRHAFTLIETVLCLGISSTWILLGMALISSLQHQVSHHRLQPLFEQKDQDYLPHEIGLLLPEILNLLEVEEGDRE